MLANMIQQLFPEGQRKVMVSLIAILIGAILDKFAGGLSQHMETLLIAGVGIFTGGNIFEHLKEVLGGTKIGQIIEDVIPGDQGLANPPAAAPVVQMAQAAPAGLAQSNPLGEAMALVGRRFEDMDKKLAVQAENVGKLVQVINNLTRQARPPAPPAPPRPPVEDDE